MNEVTKKEVFELQNGEFKLDSFQDQLNFANLLIQKRLVSETFKEPAQLVIAIQACKSLGLNPITGLKMFYVVGGKPALYGDGPLSLIQSSGKLDSLEEFFIDDKGEKICLENKNLNAEVFGAVCRMKRKGDPTTQEDFFTEVDRKNAMLNSPVWSKYKRNMMRYRVRAMCAKSKFADVLNGLEIAEYTYSDLPSEGEINNDKSKLTELNEKF